MRFLIVFLLLSFITIQGYAQTENPDVRRGNRNFSSENFQDAELSYRKALENNPQSLKALYNLANALYKQGRYDEASEILEGLASFDLPESTKADVYHNLGNSKIGKQQIKEGIEAYKNSLRLRPEDMDTRHNLAYAMQLLQEQEEDQQQQPEDQDQDQDQQDQPGDDTQPEEGNDQDQQPQRPDQISPEDAQRILDALNQQEQEVQEKIDREERQRTPQRPQREW